MQNSAYDLYLGDKASLQGYRCRSLVRDSAPLIAPRFSTGQQGQTDLDLLKSSSVDNISGGMFQRSHLDSTKVARAVGFYNSYDENFYPTLPSASATGTFAAGNVSAKIESESYSFYNIWINSGGPKSNAITKIVGSVGSAVTMPAGLSTAAGIVNQLCLHKGYLFTANAPGGGFSDVNCFRYDIAGNSWQDLSCTLALFFTLRGNLYGINKSSALYSVTNETAAGAATLTQLATVGGTDLPPLEAVEFNGAAWITKANGLYRFDGTTSLKVLGLKASKLTVWNGALWFLVGNWLYRFDGSVVQKVQYFTDTIYQISASSERLFFFTWSTTPTQYDSPKDIGAGAGYFRIYAYDGLSFSICIEKAVTTETGIDHCLIYSSSYLTYVQMEFNSVSWDNTQTFALNLANIFSASAVTANSLLDVTSSEDDAGFPNIFKSLELLEINYSDLIAGDVLTVKYQLHNGKAWGSWQTLGTITSTSTSNYLEVTDFSNKLYKRIKINVYASTIAAGSTLKLHGFSWRWTLQPRMRWRWQAHLLAYGNVPAMFDRNNTALTDDANLINNNLIQSIKSKTPIFLGSPDYATVYAQINNSALSLVISGRFPLYTDPYSEYPLIMVKNFSGIWEILRISAVSYDAGTDRTTLTILERGYLGISPAQINAGAEVHLAYRVYVTRLLRDNPIFDDEHYNQQSTGESQLQREFLLELTEV